MKAVSKPRRRSTTPPGTQRASRPAAKSSAPPVPRYSTHRPKKPKLKAPDVVIADRDDEPSRQGGEAPLSDSVPTTRPPPPVTMEACRSEPRMKRGEMSETSISELIAELMIDLSPPSAATGKRDTRRPGAQPPRKKERLPRAVVDEVVADRKKDPRSE
jgi:hypothetical protein